AGTTESDVFLERRVVANLSRECSVLSSTQRRIPHYVRGRFMYFSRIILAAADVFSILGLGGGPLAAAAAGSFGSTPGGGVRISMTVLPSGTVTEPVPPGPSSCSESNMAAIDSSSPELTNLDGG